MVEKFNRVDIADKFAQMWITSRMDAGKSQEWIAKAMGVSRKTVQNWETGLSCPNQRQGFEWFQALGLQPLPYYLRLLYSDFEAAKPESDDAEISAALLSIISDLPADSKRKILYIASGIHGSSPSAILELLTAHLQTPLDARVNIASSVLNSYEMSKARNELTKAEHIQPNMELLEHALKKAKKAVKDGYLKYSAEDLEEDA